MKDFSKEIIKMITTTTNDTELGAKIRAYYTNNKKDIDGSDKKLKK